MNNLKIAQTRAISFSLWALTRALVLGIGLGAISYPGGEYAFGDVTVYDWWAGNMVAGFMPINDPMWQYPPLAAPLFYLGYQIGAPYVGFVALATIADLGIWLLLARATTITTKGLWIWTIAPILIGPIFLGRFDVFPTLVVVAGLLLASRPKWVGQLSAIGLLLKVWPVLLLTSLRRNQLRDAFSGFIPTLVIGIAIASVLWSDAWGFLVSQRDRGLQIESVAALPYVLLNTTELNFEMASQYGAIEFVAAPGAFWAKLLLTLVGLALITQLAVWRLAGHLDEAPAAQVLLTVVLISICSSRVLSPQYLIWVVGILAVIWLIDVSDLNGVTLALFAVSVIGQCIYPPLYISLQEGDLFPALVHAVRILLLVSATLVMFGRMRNYALVSKASI